MPGPATTLRTFMKELVDYAGLYPPAARSMREATAEYDAHRSSADAWALGRFIVAADRLQELADELRDLAAHDVDWRLSAVARSSGNAQRIADFNTLRPAGCVVDVAEWRPMPPAELSPAIRSLPPGVVSYAEIAMRDDPSETHEALENLVPLGARAKLRTGGTVPSAFPSAAVLSRTLAHCAQLRVPFKATAGLHHPLCGTHPLTYEPAAPRGRMFGFVNVFTAAMLALQGTPREVLEQVLTEEDATAFDFGDGALRWNGLRLAESFIASARSTFAIAFGSCSFQEPMADLRSLGWLRE